MSKTALTLLNAMEQVWLVEKIRDTELPTTGEIRVHLEDYSLENPLERATEVFKELNMHDTRYRNGVLVYVAVAQQRFSIIGDMGVNHVVADNFWNEQINLLKSEFAKANYYEGLAKVINHVGGVLQYHFPIGEDSNPNEQPDDISYA